MQNIVLLTVHLENKINFLWRCQEPLTIVLGYSSFDVVVDENFLIVGLVVLPVGMTLNDFLLHIEYFHWNFGCEFLKCLADELPVPCLQKVA